MPEYDITTNWPEDRVLDFLEHIPDLFSDYYTGAHSEVCRSALDAALHSIMGHVEKDFRAKAWHNRDEQGDDWIGLSPRRIRERLAKTRDVYHKKLGLRLLKLRESRGDIGYEDGGQLPILIDEGNLVRAMSQGAVSGSGSSVNYQPTEGQDIHRGGTNSIEMDTTVSNAHAHQYGQPDKHLPRRKLVPDTIPDAWQEEATAVVSEVICEFIVEILSESYDH